MKYQAVRTRGKWRIAMLTSDGMLDICGAVNEAVARETARLLSERNAAEESAK